MKTCDTCQHFLNNECQVGPQAVDRHGDDAVQDWVANPDQANACSFYKPTIKAELNYDKIRISALEKLAAMPTKWRVFRNGKPVEEFDNESMAMSVFHGMAAEVAEDDKSNYVAIYAYPGNILIDSKGQSMFGRDPINMVMPDAQPKKDPTGFDSLKQVAPEAKEQIDGLKLTEPNESTAKANREKLIELRKDLEVLAPNDPKRPALEFKVRRLENVSASLKVKANELVFYSEDIKGGEYTVSRATGEELGKVTLQPSSTYQEAMMRIEAVIFKIGQTDDMSVADMTTEGNKITVWGFDGAPTYDVSPVGPLAVAASDVMEANMTPEEIAAKQARDAERQQALDAFKQKAEADKVKLLAEEEARKKELANKDTDLRNKIDEFKQNLQK